MNFEIFLTLTIVLLMKAVLVFGNGNFSISNITATLHDLNISTDLAQISQKSGGVTIESHIDNNDIPNTQEGKNTSNLQMLAKSTYSKVLPCLTKNKFARKVDFQKWALPPDAESHYRYLLDATAKFRNIEIHEAHGFRGPWIENLFIDKFMGKPLSYFQGMIPLFIQWVDIHCHDFKERKNASVPEHRHLPLLLTQLLRPDVIYFTVSQDDQGIGLKLASDRPNILTLSAGGFGHVPLPLVMGELNYTTPPSHYNIEVGFYGSPRPRLSRYKMLGEIQTLMNRQGLAHKISQSASWMDDLLNTKFNLAPRGFGRTSYRLAEVVQSGRVPVYMYDDVEWLPYMGTNLSVKEFGLSGKMGNLEPLVKRLKELTSQADIHELEAKVRDAREYYTLPGVVKQIEMFISDPFGPSGGSLRCMDFPEKDHRKLQEQEEGR